MSDSALLWQVLIDGLLAAGRYALIAVGFGLIYRTTKFFNLAHGALYSCGAYCTYVLAHNLSVPVLAAIVASAALSGFLGTTLNFLIYRRLRSARASDLSMLVAGLGVFALLQNLISAMFGDEPRLVSNAIPGTISFFGATLTAAQLLLLVVAVGLCGLMTAFLWATSAGNAILAVGSDQKLAEYSGIDTDKVISQVFFLGSAMAGLAGALVALDTDITPLGGFDAMLVAVAAVLIGGVGSPLGWLAGAALLGIAQNVGVWHATSQWQSTIAFALVLLFLIIRPGGIVSAAIGTRW